jgi:hypothetical protein
LRAQLLLELEFSIKKVCKTIFNAKKENIFDILLIKPQEITANLIPPDDYLKAIESEGEDSVKTPQNDVLNADKRFFSPPIHEDILSFDEKHEVKQSFEQNKPFLDELGKIIGKKIDSLTAFFLWDSLDIETREGYIWPVWGNKQVQAQVVTKLQPFMYRFYSNLIENRNVPILVTKPVIQFLLNDLKQNIDELNLSREISDQRKIKLFEYSGHDIVLALILKHLGVYDDQKPPEGSNITIELHQNEEEKKYFIKIWYLKDVFDGQPEELRISSYNPTIGGCDLDDFLSVANHS